MLTRRQFHTRLMAALALSVASPRLSSAAPASGDDLWLNRLTYGASPSSRREFSSLGPQAWLESQLAMPVSDPDLEARLGAAKLRANYEAGEDENGGKWDALDEMRGLTMLNAAPEDLLKLVDWDTPMEYSERSRPAYEVISASLIRAVHAKAQLREVMAQFWHEHFSVNALKDEYTAISFVAYDRVMRENAFGNFRILLGNIARSPAMLYYLNNADSIASPANENFARELLELHTLGVGNYLNDRYSDWRAVPGAEVGLAEGYLDLDVYEVARAFTGWSVGDGREFAEGDAAPMTGQFFYVGRHHDPYQKRVLGREFAPNRGSMEDGDEVMDILAAHPGTARFICTKLARRLLADEPSTGLVETLAGVFLAAKDAPDQIAQVIRALVAHPDFAAPPQKIRRPFEYLAALYRVTEAEVADAENSFHWQLSRAGWRQHESGPPTGHPDVMAAWTGASSLNRMVDLAVYGLEDWFEVARSDMTSVEPNETTADFLARWADQVVPGQGAGAAEAVMQAWGITPEAPALDYPDDERAGAARAAVAMAALTPAFVMR